jgi:hypothetical protein
LTVSSRCEKHLTPGREGKAKSQTCAEAFMSSITGPYEWYTDIEMLEGLHANFSGLITLTLATGSAGSAGEVEQYRYCQEQIGIRIRQLREGKPNKP